MPNYIDIACNFTHQAFDKNLPEVIEQAEKVGVRKFVLTCSSLRDINKINEIKALLKEKVLFMTGIHPHCAKEIHEFGLSNITKAILDTQPDAIGETGLDFNRNFSSPEDQLLSFQHHLSVAQETKLPLYLHQREAHDIFLTTLKESQAIYNNPFVVHCFTGNRKELEAYLNMGGFIGITGWICDYARNQELAEAIRYIPLDRLMVETDCPYLLPKNLDPKPKRNLNYPYYLPHIVKEIGLIRNESEQLIAENAYKNTLNFFNQASIDLN
jgi:TatD DNase family protein